MSLRIHCKISKLSFFVNSFFRAKVPVVKTLASGKKKISSLLKRIDDINLLFFFRQLIFVLASSTSFCHVSEILPSIHRNKSVF